MSLMSIVDERSIFNHESRSYLNVSVYVALKWPMLALLSVLQTLELAIGPHVVQWFVGANRPHGEPRCAGVRVMTGHSGVGIGLCLSAP